VRKARITRKAKKVIKISNSGKNISSGALSVALCTYNGGAYLQEQLESIAAQTLPPAELVVCDDGSTDNTMALIRDYARRAPFAVRLYDNEHRLGVIANYSRAVSLCRGDYIALCDQDDLWCPEKLELSLDCMRGAEERYGQKTPLMVHSDLQVVDLQGRIMAASLMKSQNIHHVEDEPLKTLLAQNFVTGCTVLLNRPLAEAALPLPEKALMHDWWFALVASVLGRIVFLPRPTVSYRQHGGNTVGAKKFISVKSASRLARVKELEHTIARTVEQGLALLDRLEQRGTAALPPYLAGYLKAARQNGKEAAAYARSHGITKQGRLRRFVFLLLLARGRYLEYLEENCAAERNYC